MKKRLLRSLLLAPAIVVLMLGAAVALEATTGSGLTHNGASLGFNAKKDLTGQITYVSHDGTFFMVQCDELTSYRNLKPTAKGYLRTKVTATCLDQDGNTIYVEIYFVDRGEGASDPADIERIFFSYDPAYALDANGDPNAWTTECNTGFDIAVTGGCQDTGTIQTGNVQILQDPDPTLSSTIHADPIEEPIVVA